MTARRVIDHQTHWLPPDYLDALLGRRGYPRASRRDHGYLFETAEDARWTFSAKHVDLDAHFADMDAHGVDLMISSPGIIGEFAGLAGQELHEAADRLNEATAKAQREHPDRFAGLAVLPLAAPETALRVLDRAIVDLDLRGVCVYSNTAGTTPISVPELSSIYRRIEALGVPIFLHPNTRSMLYDVRHSPIIERGLAWMCDTSVAAASLVLDGVLDACPDLLIVHPHLGGVLPYVTGRLSASARVIGQESRPMGHYLRHRFFTDTAGDTPGAFALAVGAYGEDRILYATDYPFKPRAAMNQLLTEQDGRTLNRSAILANRLPGF